MARSEYERMKERQRKRFDDFFGKYGFSAFSERELAEGMMGLKLRHPEDDRRIVHIGGGMYVLRSKYDEFVELGLGFDEELRSALKDDEFFVDALAYEMGNHEYIVTQDPFESLNELDLSVNEVLNDSRMSRLFKRAEDRYFGIEGIEVTDTNRYFIDVRRTDYTYGPEDAIREFLSMNPDVAEGIAWQHWSENDPDDQPFNWDDFEDMLDSMGAVEAFWKGVFSDRIGMDEDWVVFDGYGNVSTIDDLQLERMCVRTATSPECVSAILRGDIEIPPDMAEVVGLFMHGDSPKNLTISRCVKSKHALRSKSVRRGTMSIKKNTTVRKVAPKRSSTNPNKRSPVPKTKSAVKRTSGKRAAPKKVTKRPTVKSAPVRKASANKAAPRRAR